MHADSIKVLLRIRDGRTSDSGCLKITGNMVKWNDHTSSKTFSYDRILDAEINQAS